MKPIIVPSMVSLALSLGAIACKNEAPRDADPCAKASANAARLAAEDPETQKKYGAEPFTADRCKGHARREEVQCIGYASSWNELLACSPDAIKPVVVQGG